VSIDNAPFTDEASTARAVEVARRLADWAVGFRRRLCVVPHGDNLNAILQNSSRRLACILCKRMMYRIAEQLAERMHAEGIVTGEALGEQASQTLRNLRVLSAAVRKYPVHRPVFVFDKPETERLARKIGVYEMSSQRATGCGAVPRKPVTRAKLEDVVKAEERLDVESMVERSVGGLRVINL
jgi:thiamine biosynthesis protein ThiI